MARPRPAGTLDVVRRTGCSRLRTRGAATALVGGLVLGIRDTLQQKPKVPIVIDHPGDEPLAESIVLFFHPEVPEATLVLIR